MNECELCEMVLFDGELKNTVLVEIGNGRSHRLYKVCNDCRKDLREVNSDPSHIFTLQEIQSIAIS